MTKEIGVTAPADLEPVRPSGPRFERPLGLLRPLRLRLQRPKIGELVSGSSSKGATFTTGLGPENSRPVDGPSEHAGAERGPGESADGLAAAPARARGRAAGIAEGSTLPIGITRGGTDVADGTGGAEVGVHVRGGAGRVVVERWLLEGAAVVVSPRAPDREAASRSVGTAIGRQGRERVADLRAVAEALRRRGADAGAGWGAEEIEEGSAQRTGSAARHPRDAQLYAASAHAAGARAALALRGASGAQGPSRRRRAAIGGPDAGAGFTHGAARHRTDRAARADQHRRRRLAHRVVAHVLLYVLSI